MAVYSDSSKQYLQDLLKITNYNPVAIGYQKLTVAGTAVGLTVPADSRYAVITVETTATIRYLELGASTLPTSTDGLPKSNLDVFDVLGYSNLINFRAIQTAAGTHTLHIQYYK